MSTPYIHTALHKYELGEIGHQFFDMDIWCFIFIATGKSLSETLLFAEHGENMLFTKLF